MKRLSLPDVTLCAVTSVALPETIRALQRCLDQVDFGTALLLTDQAPPAGAPPDIAWRRIAPIKSREEYCEFILRSLVGYVDRPHVLVVQWDGFVIDASQWRSEFLQFDYIGAPWPQFDDGQTVGNGGFSLRSKRLLTLTSAPEFRGRHPEDVAICRTHRRELEQQGIRFAPQSIAEQFSFERGPPTKSFGFHGLFNFPVALSPGDLEATLDALDPALLGGRDGADLIVELARRGETRLAWRLARLRRQPDGVRFRMFRFWLRFGGALLRSVRR